LNDRFLIERPECSVEDRVAMEKLAKEESAKLEQSIKESNAGNEEEIARSLNIQANDLWESLFDWRIKDRLIHRKIALVGWKEKDAVIVGEFKNYHPKDAIHVGYFLTIFPKKAQDIPVFIKSLLDDAPSKEDLSDLREIYLAWWGIVPKSESVRKFVSNQRWYSPKNGMTVNKLTSEQNAVIAAIEQYHPVAH
jgi:hypothetical protein